MLVTDNFACVRAPERKKDNLVSVLMINKRSKNDENPFIVTVAFWDKDADTIEKYVKPGKTLLISGHLSQRDYNDKTYFDLSAATFTFTGGGSGGDSPKPAEVAVTAGSSTEDEDNIPF